MFGALLSERISTRSGLAILLLMLVIGPASAFYWHATGDLSLYAGVQFGGMAAILVLLSLTPRGRDPFPWWALPGVVARMPALGKFPRRTRTTGVGRKR